MFSFGKKSKIDKRFIFNSCIVEACVNVRFKSTGVVIAKKKYIKKIK